MRFHIVGCALGVTMAVVVTDAARAQQPLSVPSQVSVRPVAPTPWVPLAVDSARADTATGGPRLPPVVHPAAARLLRDDAPAVAQDKIVIPVTTAVIVLAVVVLILLID